MSPYPHPQHTNTIHQPCNTWHLLSKFNVFTGYLSPPFCTHLSPVPLADPCCPCTSVASSPGSGSVSAQPRPVSSRSCAVSSAQSVSVAVSWPSSEPCCASSSKRPGRAAEVMGGFWFSIFLETHEEKFGKQYNSSPTHSSEACVSLYQEPKKTSKTIIIMFSSFPSPPPEKLIPSRSLSPSLSLSLSLA